MTLQPLPDECEAWLSDGSDLVAEEMEFGQGWNSPSHTKDTNESIHKEKDKHSREKNSSRLKIKIVRQKQRRISFIGKERKGEKRE